MNSKGFAAGISAVLIANGCQTSQRVRTEWLTLLSIPPSNVGTCERGKFLGGLLDEPPPGGTFLSLKIGHEVYRGREIRLRFDTTGRAIELRDDNSYPGGAGVTKFHAIGASLDSTGGVISANEVSGEGTAGPKVGFRIVDRSALAPSRFREIVAVASELRRRCG